MYFEDLKLGDKLVLEDFSMTTEEIIGFAKLYDNIPLHTDEEFAKNTRFKGLIAPGIMTFLKAWEKYIETNVHAQHVIAGMSNNIEWHLPVYANQTISSTVTISDLIDKNRYNGILEVKLESFNQENKKVLTATCQALVAKRVVE